MPHTKSECTGAICSFQPSRTESLANRGRPCTVIGGYRSIDNAYLQPQCPSPTRTLKYSTKFCCLTRSSRESIPRAVALLGGVVRVAISTTSGSPDGARGRHTFVVDHGQRMTGVGSRWLCFSELAPGINSIRQAIWFIERIAMQPGSRSFIQPESTKRFTRGAKHQWDRVGPRDAQESSRRRRQ
jgi:hypothetical protein